MLRASTARLRAWTLGDAASQRLRSPARPASVASRSDDPRMLEALLNAGAPRSALLDCIRSLSWLELYIRTGGDDDGFGISESGVVALADVVADSELSALSLFGGALGPAAAHSLADVMQRSSSLTQLSLSSTYIAPNAATLLTSSLGTSVALRSLELRYNDLRAEGLVVLAEALRANQSLTDLVLAGNTLCNVQAVGGGMEGAFTAEGVNALADALRMNTGLRSLDLHHNEIGSAGVEALASCFEGGGALATLSLQLNSIESDGAETLARAVSDNSSLRTLDLRKNGTFDVRCEAALDELVRTRVIAGWPLAVKHDGKDSGRRKRPRRGSRSRVTSRVQEI
jgi:hypothetical protein